LSVVYSGFYYGEKQTMSLDRSQVETVARLARLKIEESELDTTVSSLNSILELVDHLQAVDTTGVEPLANPLDAAQRLRADVVSEENQREKLQANAPAAEKGLFLVPKVIE
jgi:aspartyl-tRNA(Asn)/glutamyl-tRNA(Gln) amidotransferase subunit C